MNDFIIKESFTIYILISISLLVIIPFILVGIRKKLFNNFTYLSFVETLNRALYFEIIIGLFALVLTYIMQKAIYISNDGIDLLIIQICFSFVLFLILFVPIVLILNVIKYFAYNDIKIDSH
jgi:hypothetical protein